MLFKPKRPYIRDVFQAKLIHGAKWAGEDEYPVIEPWMVPTTPPKELIQWDRRYDVTNPADTGICFYCNDGNFTPVLNNPQLYVEKFRAYSCIVGIDPSPYDNMPLVVQKSQIFNNLALTYYYGNNGIKVIPNVRMGNNKTMGALVAYPRETLIAIGTHGFLKTNKNRVILKEQIAVVAQVLRPTGILVYGAAPEDIFGEIKASGIPIYQYDSYTMKQNLKDRMARMEKKNEGE